MIKSRVIYETDNKQFETFEKAVSHREGMVEKFFRECPGFYELRLKDRTAFVEKILENRSKLVELLSYNSMKEDDDWMTK